MPCQNGHWGHILPHVEIVGRDLPVCKDITADGGFTATNIQFITLKKKETQSARLSHAGKKTWHFKNRNKTGREKLYGTVQSDETVQVTYYFKD